jgi:transcriptional regulator EpsA
MQLDINTPSSGTSIVASAASAEEQARRGITGMGSSLGNASESNNAEAVLRVIESAAHVRRRYQFFVWSQSYLSALVPHDLSICASYHRARQSMVFETFNARPFPDGLLPLLSDTGSLLLQGVISSWMASGGVPTIVDLVGLARRTRVVDPSLLSKAGIEQLMVHGVSRPQRPDELESLFMFSNQVRPWSDTDRRCLEMILPQLHSAYLRAQSVENDLTGVATGALLVNGREHPTPITERERQILGWVREGKSNQEIGKLLCISALTVKNHVQKILRKLNAANRAQAVARAMSLRLIET